MNLDQRSMSWRRSEKKHQVAKPANSGVRLQQARTTSASLHWWAHRDLNPEPKDYESSALTD